MPDLHRRTAAELLEDRMEARIEPMERRLAEVATALVIALAAVEHLTAGQSAAALAELDDARAWLWGQADDDTEV